MAEGSSTSPREKEKVPKNDQRKKGPIKREGIVERTTSGGTRGQLPPDEKGVRK